MPRRKSARPAGEVLSFSYEEAAQALVTIDGGLAPRYSAEGSVEQAVAAAELLGPNASPPSANRIVGSGGHCVCHLVGSGAATVVGWAFLDAAHGWVRMTGRTDLAVVERQEFSFVTGHRKSFVQVVSAETFPLTLLATAAG